jgi:DNA-damage-inducible protein J
VKRVTSTNERERKSATVRARIEPSLKEEAERILKEIGLDPTTAVAALYRQIVARNGMPFEFELTDERSRMSVQKAQRGEVKQAAAGDRPEAPKPPVVRKYRTRDTDDSPLPFPD